MPASGLLTVLNGNDPSKVNSFAQPTNIAPVESTIAIKGKQVVLTAAPYFFSIIRLKK